jgi:guanine deaminase
MLDLLVTGRIFHSFGFNQLETEVISIGIKDGIIVYIGSEAVLAKEQLMLTETQFLIPGFIDTHIHAPQYCFTGTGYDKPLLGWLESYTFPRESKFGDLNFAEKCYRHVVKRTLASGTTTSCYYATIHSESSLLLGDICSELGQRAFIGKVCMDRNAPDYYIETSESCCADTMDFVQKLMSRNDPLITPCITPRFAPSCTDDTMIYLANLAKERNLPIQSHLSETPAELQWVKELYPNHESYAAVYDSFGLLGTRTVMAHCIHLSKKERELLLLTGTGISHCASSNFGLSSGVLNVSRLIEEGFEKVGLGTDVAGGYSSSMLDSIRQAIIASKVTHINSRDSEKVYQPIGYEQALYMATLGGAKTMNLHDKLGNFVIGKEFDALVIDVGTTIDIYEEDNEKTLIEKFIYLGDDRNVIKVFVAGKQVK